MPTTNGDAVRSLFAAPEVAPLKKTSSWSILCAALTSANVPSVIPSAVTVMVKDVTTKHNSEIVQFLRAGREAIFKAYTVAGTPKAINGLTEFRTAAMEQCPDAWRKLEDTTAASRIPEKFSDVQAWTARGEGMFDTIYNCSATRLKTILSGLHPDLLPLILSESYGKVLSNGDALDLKDTELVMVAALKVQGGAVSKQVESHRRGAIRMGVSQAEVEAAEFIADQIVVRFVE
ncbi:peroxiredoxin [Spizellomyces sp. 'palustris']|nr:peroxiredoxin [Spizellomyces sp. 'palustris']